MLPVYVVIAVPPTLAGVAVVLAVIRAKKDDLPAIVRALMRVEPPDDDKLPITSIEPSFWQEPPAPVVGISSSAGFRTVPSRRS